MSTAAPAFVPTFISFDDDDDFGEFEFAPATASSSPPIPPPHCAASNQQQWQKPPAEEDDDDWGDFIEGPLQPLPFSSPAPPPLSPPSSSSLFDPFPAAAAAPDPASIGQAPPAAAGGAWQKPSGALPLSLFGEEDEEDGAGEESSNSLDSHISAPKTGVFASFKSAGSNALVSAQGGGLKDLIASLYGQADQAAPAVAANGDGSGGNTKTHSGNGANSGFAVDGDGDDEDELNETCWEFQDAVSSTNVEDSSDSVLVEKEGELAGVPRDEAKAAGSGSGFQTSGNYILNSNGIKCESMLGANLPSRVVSDKQKWANAFGSHDTSCNGFDFRSIDNGCNGHISNSHNDFEHINTENGLNPTMVNGEMNLDDSFWEFKDAPSNKETMNCFTESKSIGQVGLNGLENLYMSASSNEKQDFGNSFLIIEGHQFAPNSIDNGTEDDKTCSAVGFSDPVSNVYNDTCNISAVTLKQNTHGDHNSSVSCETLKGADSIDLKYSGLESDKIKDNNFVSERMDACLDISAEPTVFVDFYSRLKQKSCTLVLHHIDDLKLRKADEKEVTDEELKAVYSNDEIKMALSKLGIGSFKSDHVQKSLPNEFSINELLEVLQKPGFQAFDMEYGLSEKIPLAVKDLSSAMWLFEHASHTLCILTLASDEEQRSYVISWSKMASACEKELQHGAAIWSQALHADIHMQLLAESQGQRYFLALGEIYRVVEILSASIILYKAWILLNPADSRELLTCIKKSIEVWTGSLKQALQISTESFGELKVVTEELLESIKFISELSSCTLQTHFSSDEAHFCRLSLLPLEVQPEVKQVAWEGDRYFSKLANLWANRISSDAPRLPHIHVGR